LSVLAPISDEQYAAFIAMAIADYAADKVAAGQWAEDQALELSRKEYQE